MENTVDKVIITVVGKDTVGIIAKVCTYLSENHINVLDISQTMDEDQAFILPIDTPFLEPEVGLQLLEHLDGFDIAAVSGTETDQKVPASAYSKSCLPSIGKCLLLHQFTFDTLREKCSVSYLKREEATKDSDIPADLQFSHLDTRDDYYRALRHLHCI